MTTDSFMRGGHGSRVPGPGKSILAAPALTRRKRARHRARMEPRPSPLKLAALVLLGAAGAALGWWWLHRHGYNLRLAIYEGIALLRSMGPVAFFVAMAVLPAAGAPIVAFYLTAGSAFSPQLGLGGVIACAFTSLAVNMALTHWLASQALRPWLETWIARTRFHIPQLEADEHAELTLLVRITPGPPFFTQSYLLGLAGVRFVTYMWVSCVVVFPFAAGFIAFGDAILHGKARLAILGLSALAAVSLIVHFLRKHYGKKQRA
jgi:uncharacterized membrane protein YdjX (TVP38/TMEM64 family)